MGSNLFGFFFPFLTAVQESAAESSFARALVVLTNRGILIRTATAIVGIVVLLIGIILLVREPIANAAIKVGGAVL